jgi:hypothetical protein
MAVGSIAFGVAIAAALVFVYAAVLGPTFAGTAPLLAGFEARSYAPGETATLRIAGGGTSKVTLLLFLGAGTHLRPRAALIADFPTVKSCPSDADIRFRPCPAP